MPHTGRKSIESLKEGLVGNLRLDFFDEEEITAVLKIIDFFDPRLKQRILALSLSLSNASSSLVGNALNRFVKVSRRLPFKEFEKWIARAFDLMDSRGIDSFMEFTSKTAKEDLAAFQQAEGLHLQGIAHLIETYLRAVSGLDLRVAPDRESYTDTDTVYLPPVINRFKEREGNFLLYKLMAAHKWAQIKGGTLTPDVPGYPDFGTYLDAFPDKDMALDIYNIVETVRLEGLLAGELPGLVGESVAVKAKILEGRPDPGSLSPKTAFVEGIYQSYLKGDRESAPASGGSAESSMEILKRLYREAEGLDGEYSPLQPAFFLGAIRPEKVSARIRLKERARKKQVEGRLRALMSMPEFIPTRKKAVESEVCERTPKPDADYLLIRGRLLELDSELRDIIDEMKGISGGILVKGSDIGAARHCIILKDDLFEADGEELEARGGSIRYDEWDFRRGGYKKHWCSLYEHDVHPDHEPFVELTLQRYGGYVSVLRKKFELLKREPRILRRQREGDGIDIDAIIEAFADMHAGIAPGEDLFTRLDRHERNIAVLFLLDMSGSTKGWVSQAEKEALVLMCEALEALGDRYAIYGFSGMTRTRCDFYRIKSFDEAYAEAVKQRISGITPKDYTRMGPAIRHSAGILGSVEARTKLFITLSDGKPEDWDAYKGDYGIEDTKKALIETREKGIHAFCITIDKEASSYLPHMYGEGNYILIDDVRKLPNRITEIYRRLTT